MEHTHANVVKNQNVDSSFLEEVKKTVAGKKILDCIQCGVCAGSCHARFAMDYGPMQIIKMAQLGLKEDVLSSSTIWICASCYTCTSRCPRGIDIPLLMSSLKNMAIENNVPAKIPAKPKFHKAFTEIVGKYGRMHEAQLQVRLMNKTSPKALFDNASLGLKMWRKGKVQMRPPRMRGKTEVKTIFRSALRNEEKKK
ncbi:MAG TPA: 4Fe-4S dicluster domain-containing protein [Candidatus Acidoferrales bacterium]|nr:4Fe-4S dicluster domain-containing protein [Candidatus Acidoferrales bacterium]